MSSTTYLALVLSRAHDGFAASVGEVAIRGFVSQREADDTPRTAFLPKLLDLLIGHLVQLLALKNETMP